MFFDGAGGGDAPDKDSTGLLCPGFFSSPFFLSDYLFTFPDEVLGDAVALSFCSGAFERTPIRIVRSESGVP